MSETSAHSDAGTEMYSLVEKLYPICRSITGDGVRDTLRILQQHVPLEIIEVPSGTKVFDWTVPKEWNIRDAYIKNSQGERVVDFLRSNLHVMNYSIPVRGTFTLEALRPHLHTLPDRPEWIPHRTSYFEENWGFCLSHRQYETLEEDTYEVCIDASLEPGSLTYGEYILPGKSEAEVLFSTHVCHPSLCNDNLSGITVSLWLAQYLRNLPERHYTYRFLFIPSTIGSITWLARNRDILARIRHGMVLSILGDGSPFTYKKSRQGDAFIDRVMEHLMQHAQTGSEVIDFFPFGYDERQYCSPGFNLPVGLLNRARFGQFPEYHTSADNLDLVKPAHLAESLELLIRLVEVLEHNRFYRSLSPYGEPQLGKRGLYGAVGGAFGKREQYLAMLWVLNLADGAHDLLAMAEKSGLDFTTIRETATQLESHRLLEGLALSPRL